jgi:hypothetical protein
MAYSKRIPPIKVKLNVNEFNKLVEILNNMIDFEDEKISQKSSKIKDKLLRYSVPIKEDDGTEMVDMRFYNNEITDLFYILFYGVEDIITIETNYYDVLIRVREKLKEEKVNNE